jgi:hypothetical protein
MNKIVAQKLKMARSLIGDNQLTASKKSGILQKDISLMESGKKKYIPIQYLSYLLRNDIDLNTLFNEKKELEKIEKKDQYFDLKNQNLVLENKVEELNERLKNIRNYLSTENLLETSSLG